MMLLKTFGLALLILVIFVFANTLGLFKTYLQSAVSPNRTAVAAKREIGTTTRSNDATTKSTSALNTDDRPVPLLADPHFATDTQYVYSYGNVVVGGDPKTFVALNSAYKKDQRRAYYGREDIGSILDSDAVSFVAIDTRFYPASIDIRDEENFSWMQSYAKDINHVYYDGIVVPDADPQSFTLLQKYYAEDFRYIYFLNRKVMGADRATFVTVAASASYDAMDAQHKFQDGQLVQ